MADVKHGGHNVSMDREFRSPTPGTSHSVRTTRRRGAVRTHQVLPISVVIPTLNEGRNIGHVLELMPPVQELIVVDGQSVDDTIEVVLAHVPDAVILVQERRGKGAAMRAGFEAATAPYVVAIDGDGSMSPLELGSFVALFERGYDMVKGSRAACGGGSSDLTALRRAGNFGLLKLHNAMFGAQLTDLCYGYIGFRRDRLDALGLYADGFEIEAQLISHAALAGLTIAEVPSFESDRLTGESNLRTFPDGRRVLKQLLRSRLQPGRELWRSQAADCGDDGVITRLGPDEVAPVPIGTTRS